VLLGNKDYMTTIDIWSIGCIFAEMVSGKALFTGVSDQDQIKKIFRIMGTPTEKSYNNIIKLPDWDPEFFEDFPKQDLKQYAPGLEDDGFDLLEKMLKIDPDKRICTEEALSHSYFKEIQDTIVKEIYK
jgi:cyclin-dependent kinase